MIVDQNLQTFAEASEFATAYLAEHKDPVIEGRLSIEGVIAITPGETCIVDFPHNNINNQVYSIIQANYVFNTNNCTGDKVLKLKLNKKVSRVEDTIKELILRQKELESEVLEGNLTRLETATGSVGIENHYEIYSLSGTNYGFRFNLQGADVLNSPHAVLGPWINGSTLLTSGGDF